MKDYIRIILLALGLAVGSQANAGIPVIDATNLAQQVQQVVAWGKQYSQMVQQYGQLAQQIQQMQQHYASITGGRGLSDLLNSSLYQQARRTLPPDAQQVLDLANGGSFGGLANSINSIKTAATTLNTSSFTSPTAANQWQADLNRAATNKALSMQAYTDAAQRLQNMEDLTAQISLTQDPKAIQELQARIGTEQGMIQNEQAKVQAMSLLASAEQQIAQQQARETSIKTAGSVANIPRVIVAP